MRRLSSLALSAVLACHREAPPSPSAADAAPVADAALPVATGALSVQDASIGAEAGGADASVSAGDAGSAAAVSPDDYLTSPPKSGKSIGHTSVVYKIELANGKKAAWKPASKRGPIRWKGEVAAYKLGVALGIANVPPAFERTFTSGEARTIMGDALPVDAIEAGGKVDGAIMPWIPKLFFLALESEPLLSQWKGWLKTDGAVPDEMKKRAAQVSTMVVFDFVTANWDRWSGGNVGMDPSTGDVLFIDNDGAFFEVPPKDAVDRQRKLLAGVDRFSASFVGALEKLDEAKLFAGFLSSKAIEGVTARKKEALDAIHAKGAGAMYFP